MLNSTLPYPLWQRRIRTSQRLCLPLIVVAHLLAGGSAWTEESKVDLPAEEVSDAKAIPDLLRLVYQGRSDAAQDLVRRVCALPVESRSKLARRVVDKLAQTDNKATRIASQGLTACKRAPDELEVPGEVATTAGATASDRDSGRESTDSPRGEQAVVQSNVLMALCLIAGGFGGVLAIASYLGVVIGHAAGESERTALTMVPVFGAIIASTQDQALQELTCLSGVVQGLGILLAGLGVTAAWFLAPLETREAVFGEQAPRGE